MNSQKIVQQVVVAIFIFLFLIGCRNTTPNPIAEVSTDTVPAINTPVPPTDTPVGQRPLAQEVEIVTYDVLPPFAFKNEQGEITGIYIEIVKKAVSRMPDYTVSFTVYPWSRAKWTIKEGNAFAIVPPYFHAHDWLTDTEPKRPYIWPYSRPLYTQYDVVICNAAVLTKARSAFPDDFAGLDFVLYRGDGRAGVKFDQMVENGEVNLYILASIENTIPFLLEGRADCTVATRETFAWYLEQFKETEESSFAIEDEVVLQEAAILGYNEGYLGYTDIDAEKNYPFKKDFSIKFDIELYKMRNNGEIQEIVNTFIK